MRHDHLVFMRFRPMWAYIEGTREFCRFFCATTFATPDVAERVQLVVQELLENAVKYSAESTCDVEIELREEAGRAFEICVRNYASPDSAARLNEELERIAGLTPDAAYLTAVQRTATLPEGTSARLGLARICLEGRVRLAASNLPDGRVQIRCQGDL